MQVLQTQNQQIKELEELASLISPTAYAFSNEKVSNIAKDALLIIKELQEENKNFKEKIKIEATKIYNTTKDNKYNYHACELDGDDEEEIFNSSKLILNILNND